MVFISTGQVAAKAANVILVWASVPSSEITSGVNATGGRGRRNAGAGVLSAPRPGARPRRSPRPTASTVATARAIAQDNTVDTTSTTNLRSANNPTNRVSTNDGGGTNLELTSES